MTGSPPKGRAVRVLLGSTAGAGHFNPLVPFIDALVRRGDDVLLVVPPALEPTVTAMGHPFRIGAAPPADEVDGIWERVPVVSRSEAAVLVNREFFGRICTAALLPAVEAACSEWHPDLLLREPCDYASAVAALRFGIRHAQVGISPAEIEASALDLVAPVLTPYGEGILELIRTAPYLTRFPLSLDPSPFPDTRRFGEGAEVESEPLPDWWNGSDAPLIYLTFGSVAGDLPIAAAVYGAALAAVEPLPARVLLTVGRTFDPRSLGRLPANVSVESWVPQGRVLRSAALVVCHGGSGTVFGSLAAGVPLVIIPLWADQPANARMVTSAGAGQVVEPASARGDGMRALSAEDVPRIREAIESVLADGSYRDAARSVAEEMRSLPTIDGVLDTLSKGGLGESPLPPVARPGGSIPPGPRSA